ncbi:methyltransferase [Chondromyces apiculatus]|uniref:Methyltransferase domain-containing protein n=1 Tax=Chondromyces apiculatus DSM 436 TaxID=1192034 RepID=A0A017T6W4_9BACT|nr:methyltransferase [Chondromyces apiculatus]EYF04757.1 Hypothetical protein CAP_4233 [Chondromyces apiculatus DSM 436]
MVHPHDDASAALARALAVLLPVLDIAGSRPDGDAPPAWCEARGLTGFLLSLDDAALGRCEAEGLAVCASSLPGAPAQLVDLARATAEVTRVPPLAASPLPPPRERLRSVHERKRLQLEALLGAVAPLAARAQRIVDVGAGRGHFTRVAADLFDIDAVGLERDASRVSTAEALARGTRASFVTFDAGAQELSFGPGDLPVGLHACGALGDRMIAAAASARCDVVLVSCCLQKIDTPRRAPLSRAAEEAGLVLPREALGLANLTPRPEGVEASLGDMLAMRERRHALLRLLRARGLPLAPGEEMRGINRRRARDGLAALAARALSLRGLAPASAAEVEEHEAAAHQEFARMRRLSLPRAMLSRLVEVTVVLDRAAALEEQGHEVMVRTVFDIEVTPRNLAILACADGTPPEHPH